MDKDQQRIAIAEACGWDLLQKGWVSSVIGRSPFSRTMRYSNLDEPPDYLNDLNAINDAVNYLRNKNRMAYLDYGKRLDQLVAIFNSSPARQAYHGILTCDAPADMRARAVLESLNLWTPTGEENE